MYDLETDMSILSDNLIYYRKLAGKTVMDVERATGISHSTYTCWEQGYRQPRKLEDLGKVAEVFGITMDLLLYDRNGEATTVEMKKMRDERELQNLLRAYSVLNEEGKEKLTSYAEDLQSMEKYREVE